MNTVVETHDLTKTYGRSGALHGLNLAMPEHSVFALVGASGAGKTTAIKILMNILAQVLPPRLRVRQFFDYLRPWYASGDRSREAHFRRTAMIALARN